MSESVLSNALWRALLRIRDRRIAELEAKLASIRATPFQQVDPESGELAWASGYNAALKIVHNLAAEDKR